MKKNSWSLFLILLLFSFSVNGQINKSVEDDLKSDFLEEKVESEKKKLKEQQKRKKRASLKGLLYPNRNDFWDILNHYWLVQNVEKLRWEQEKTDLGIEKVIKEVLLKLSFNQSYKIIQSNEIKGGVRVLPGAGKDIFFILSPRFISRHNLSSNELIALILEELTLVRMEKGKLPLYDKGGQYFSKGVKGLAFIKKYQDFYDDFIFEKRLNLKSYFLIVDTVKNYIKDNPSFKVSYKKLLGKLKKDKGFLEYKPGVSLAEGWF